MLNIELSGELETKLVKIAQMNGLSAKEWVLEVLMKVTQNEELLEDLEDAIEAERIMKDIRSGKEKTIPWDEVKTELGL